MAEESRTKTTKARPKHEEGAALLDEELDALAGAGGAHTVPSQVKILLLAPVDHRKLRNS